ncbi:MAG TPA: peptide-methionine (R)-S-oxide reductase MsrB [Casimicrobiaceae bacterium]|nr:peptide-methionine (R)-S-oxide reductase MsrB [Casimicrobiaceae bacterium]
MQRRSFLMALPAFPLACALPRHALAAAGSVAEIQQNWKQLLATGAEVAPTTTPISKTEAEWQQLLTPAQFKVLRQEGTEYPNSSPLNAEKRAGIFACAGCALPLFSSRMKFESGTGWPSFFTLIPGSLATKEDFKMIVPRTEYHCVRCGGHHGHVFDDGPRPTGLRYCNNGVALRFVPQKAA